MMDNQHSMPGPPANFQRPGIPGAGNILDPEVRGAIREQLHEILPQMCQKAAGSHAGGAAPEPAQTETAASAPEVASPPPPRRQGMGPYPHGDVDLSFVAANVPLEPVRPQRNRGRRQFYFLPANAVSATDGAPVIDTPSHTGPKPG